MRKNKKSIQNQKNAKSCQKSCKTALKQTKNENSILKNALGIICKYFTEVYGENENLRQQSKKQFVQVKPTEKFTEDEKVILRNVPEKFKWLARDEDGFLCIYTFKTTKLADQKYWYAGDCIDDSFGFSIFRDHFKSVQWTDDEPCEFRRYL